MNLNVQLREFIAPARFYLLRHRDKGVENEKDGTNADRGFVRADFV